MPHVLIVDDDANTLSGLAELVAREGFTVATAASLQEARQSLVQRRPDVVLLDLVLPDGSGIDLFAEGETVASTEVIFITGHASVESSVQALRLRAADYLVKPVNLKRLKAILARVARPTDLKKEIDTLRGELRRLGHFGRLLGTSTAMQEVYDKIARVAPTAATVLIVGESGTGKEVVAQTVHELSRRHKAPFLAINCGAISPQLIESELFGHERGSFTGAVREHRGYFERASGGTLFLDEVTEMPIELQVKLLRVLEEGSFMRVGSTCEVEADVRVIAATNRVPQEAVDAGKLRADLLYRLQVFPLYLPPLRERDDDIRLLAQHFLDQLNRSEGQAKRFAAGALEQVHEHRFPGNVRELMNLVQRAFIMADEIIDGQHLLPERGSAGQASGPFLTVRLGSSAAEVERDLILATMERLGGTKEQVAEILGISLKTLYNRLHDYERQDKDSQAPP